MNDKFITKESNVLTRVTIKVDDKTFIIESVYSDQDMIELGMRCVEAFMDYYNISKSDIIEEMKNLVNHKTPNYELGPTRNIRVVMEQYDKRNICEAVSSFNFVNQLLECVKSCAVLSTYSPSTIDNYFEEYIDENEKS